MLLAVDMGRMRDFRSTNLDIINDACGGSVHTSPNNEYSEAHTSDVHAASAVESPVKVPQNDEDGMSENDDDDENSPKIKRRRWSDEKRQLLFSEFGQDITNKVMPKTHQITAIARKMKDRTVAQIRTQINNYVTGKLPCH